MTKRFIGFPKTKGLDIIGLLKNVPALLEDLVISYCIYRRIHPDNEEHLDYLVDLYKKSDGLEFWKPPTSVGDYVSVVASPQVKEEFEHSLTKRSLYYEQTVKNIQEAFDDQILGRKKRDTRQQLFWTNYQTIDDIYAWFNHLATTHRDIVTAITIGQSYEGRNITGVRLSRGSGRRSFFLEAGQVAADWLSPTILTYVVDQLVRGTSAEARAALDEYDWHIFPILNPDGHMFTQNSIRSWLKNRRPVFRSNEIGVDLTKNWNSQWGVSGGSFRPADNNFIGLGPFSEYETRDVSRYIETLNLAGFLSFRGFGQRFIIPFAHADIPMYNFNDMVVIGRRAMGSLAVRYGTQYIVGNSKQVHDGATGNIADWVKHRFNPPVVATYQLRDTGTWGFTLPVTQVLPSCEETYDSILAIIREAKLINFIFLIFVASVSCEKFRFDNYTLYKIFPENEQHTKILQDIQNTDVRYDFWTDPTKYAEYVNVLSGPENKVELENVLKANNMKFTVTMPNIQEAIDKEVVMKYTRSNIRSMRWDVYYNLDDIYAWLDDMAAAYSNVASIVIGGHSYEGHQIKGLKISHGPGRKVIFIESGIHAREWITPTSVCYMISELLTNNDKETQAAANDYDWYIFPVTNPDGYIWSHESFRMWRKNRRPIGSEFGVDLNRNWNNNWLVIGATIDPALNNYAGPGPFSEPETRSLSSYIRSLGDQIDLYLSMHSFGQLLLIPFGNTTEPLANYHDAMNIGRRAMGALSVRYGTQYVTGNIAEAIYFATGVSVDWVKGHLNVPLVYCYELRDKGTYGFLIPEDQILPSNQEVMDSVLVLINMKILILLVLSFSCVLCEKFRFDNYTLYKILPRNEKQIKVLQDLHEENIYDFWTYPHKSADFVSILSNPKDRWYLEDLLTNNKINFEVPMTNIQEAIDKEVVSKYTRNNVRSMQWNVYYNLADINAWLDDLVRTYPTIVSRIIGGRSYEGREIRGIKISHGSGRKAIFIESGIHAREWITMTAVCYIINELLTSNDAETRAAARDFDWYIFPVTNPDGYVWTHEHFRMWRKNRRPVGEHFGVDLNRNWNNNWLVSGASINPATDIYAGPGPFSESESRSLSTYIRSIADKIEMYLSFHSFSQLLLLPFGNTTEPLANYHDAMNIGRRAMGALSVRFGTQYVTGNIAEAIYMATGGSVDWVKDHLKIPLVYCYELRDRGQYGFLLPENQILPNNQETMDSIIELIHQAKRFGYLRG
ncbi:uncharacterized protein [Epargyreus clarus]|uniref:uncharacterized protein n=1 Tax=Epargyreus clarus TaxID=520877 RepID=UPI003C2B125B